MVSLDLRAGEKIKDGRHVGLDFYDLLIEALDGARGVAFRLSDPSQSVPRSGIAIVGCDQRRVQSARIIDSAGGVTGVGKFSRATVESRSRKDFSNATAASSFRP